MTTTDTRELIPHVRTRLLLRAAVGLGGSIGVVVSTAAVAAAVDGAVAVAAPPATTEPASTSELTLESSSKVRVLAGRPTDFWLEGPSAADVTEATFEFPTADGSAAILTSPGAGSAANPAVNHTFDTGGAALPVQVTVVIGGIEEVLTTTLEVVSVDTVSQEIEPPVNDRSPSGGVLSSSTGDLPPPPDQPIVADTADDERRADTTNPKADTASDRDVDEPIANGRSVNDRPEGDGSTGGPPALSLLVPSLTSSRPRRLRIVDDDGETLDLLPGDEPDTLVASTELTPGIVDDDVGSTTLLAASSGTPPNEPLPDEQGADPEPRPAPTDRLSPRQQQIRQRLIELCISGFIGACTYLGGGLAPGQVYVPPSVRGRRNEEETVVQEGIEGSRGAREADEDDDEEEEDDGAGTQPNRYEEPDPDGWTLPVDWYKIPFVIPIFIWESLKFFNQTTSLPPDELLERGITVNQGQLIAWIDEYDLDLEGFDFSFFRDYGISFDGVSYGFLRDQGVNFDVSYLDAVDGGVGFSSEGFDRIADDFDLSSVTFADLATQDIAFTKLEDLDRELDLTGVAVLDIAEAGVEGGYTFGETASTGISFANVAPGQLDDWVRFDGTDLATFDRYRFDLAGTSFQELIDRGANFTSSSVPQLIDPNRGLTVSGSTFESLAANTAGFGGESYSVLSDAGVNFAGRSWADVVVRDDISFADVPFSVLASDETGLDLGGVLPLSLENAGIDLSDVTDADFAAAGMQLLIDAPFDDPFRDDPLIRGDEDDDPFFDDPFRDDPLIRGDEDDEPFDDPATDDSVLNDDPYATSPDDNDPFDNDPLGIEQNRREDLFGDNLYEDLAEADPYYSNEPKPTGAEERGVREDLFGDDLYERAEASGAITAKEAAE
jgi:hypothetical protein